MQCCIIEHKAIFVVSLRAQVVIFHSSYQVGRIY